MKRLIAAMLLLITACSGNDAATSHAGTLAVTLTAAGTNDGAVVLVVSGGPILAVNAPTSYQVASNVDSAGTLIMIMGNVTAGQLVTLRVPDVTQSAAYVVTVEQVADRTSFGLLDPARYQVTVGPVP